MLSVSRRALIAGLASLPATSASAFWQSRDSNYNLAISGAPPPAGITLVGTATGTTTCTVPTHVAGDMIIISGFRSATGSPTLPTGFSAIVNGNGTTCSQRIGFKIATGTADTSGTWTNSAALVCHVYRPPSGYTLGIGTSSAIAHQTTNTINYPAITLADTSGNSWVAGFAGVNNLTNTIVTAPSGMTNRSLETAAAAQAVGHDTGAGVSSWPSTNATTTGTAGDSCSAVVEIMLLPKSLGSNLANLYQHVAGTALTYDRGLTTSSINCPLSPRPSGAGNCVVLIFMAPNGTTFTITDNLDTWPNPTTPDAHANAGSGNLDLFAFVLPNCSAGQRTIHVATGAAINTFYYDIYEFYGIATSSTVNGTTTNAFFAGPSLTAGSFTPGNNNANGGNLLLTHFGRADAGGSATNFPSRIYARPLASLLQSNIAALYTDASPSVSTAYLQATSAAINPSATAIGDTSHWDGLSLALKLDATKGTAPASGIKPNGLLHFSSGALPATASISFQCPSTGNLRVICSDDPNVNFGAIKVTDNEGNSYTPDGVSAGFFYFSNSSPNSNLVVTVTSWGGSSEASLRFYDIIGANASPFDSAIATAIASTGTAFSTPSPTMVASSGLLVANIELGQGPGLSVTTPAYMVWDLCTYTGETDIDDTENADIGAHGNFSAAGSVSVGFTCAQNTSVSGGGMIAFKP